MTGIPLDPPYARALTRLHHRLMAEQVERNRARIAAVHAASLPHLASSARQGGPDKQEAPGIAVPKASTDRSPGARSHGGRSHHGSP